MNSRNRRTLAALFEKPTRSDIRWSDVEALVRACGGTVKEREGSRVQIALGGLARTFHKPHPRPELPKATVRDLATFFVEAGIEP